LAFLTRFCQGKKLVNIGEAAQILGASPDTPRIVSFSHRNKYLKVFQNVVLCRLIHKSTYYESTLDKGGT